jgi:hypothetical protein
VRHRPETRELPRLSRDHPQVLDPTALGGTEPSVRTTTEIAGEECPRG